jgi:hypothetical protein
LIVGHHGQGFSRVGVCRAFGGQQVAVGIIGVYCLARKGGSDGFKPADQVAGIVVFIFGDPAVLKGLLYDHF